MQGFHAARFLMVLFSLLAVAAPRSSLAVTGTRNDLRKPDEWFSSADAKNAAANILSFQSDLGGWPKNVDTAAAPYSADRALLKPTFDNGATTDELRFLARIFDATHDVNYRDAFERGFDYILKAQYPTGGWPQFYPPDHAYHRYITFNDDAMVRLMEFLREACSSDRCGFLDDARRTAARNAFERGIACILKCQIKVDGKLTAWCAQHDERDYSPRPGRSFELLSLSGNESVDIVRLLMSLDHPTPQIIESINGAVAWLGAAQIRGIRVIDRPDAAAPKGFDRQVVEDPSAPPLWARFYEIGTNRPIFSDRDGVAKRQLSEIGYERRNGYKWLGNWPKRLIEQEYPRWKQKWKLDRGS
jgi:PelA/Pel-15E family pectate lyase